MNDSSYYVPSAAMVIVLLLKGRAVLRAWRDPLLRSVYALLLLSVLVFFFAAPPTIAWVNRVTAVPNFSAPLVYCLLSAFSASCLVLIINWRGGPPEATRRASRRWIAGYAVVIVATAVLFALGDAPEQRLRDFDTHYANTPFIREMIVLYLVALTVSNIAMNMVCWPWALQVHGWLRVGLLVIVAGFFCNIAFAATKLTAVVARWNGENLDHLSTYVAPAMAAAAEVVTAAGFCIPLAFQRVGDVWTTWSTYRRLSPLWRELAPCRTTAIARSGSPGGPLPNSRSPNGSPTSTTACSACTRTSTRPSGQGPTTRPAPRAPPRGRAGRGGRGHGDCGLTGPRGRSRGHGDQRGGGRERRPLVGSRGPTRPAGHVPRPAPVPGGRGGTRRSGGPAVEAALPFFGGTGNCATGQDGTAQPKNYVALRSLTSRSPCSTTCAGRPSTNNSRQCSRLQSAGALPP